MFLMAHGLSPGGEINTREEIKTTGFLPQSPAFILLPFAVHAGPAQQT